MLLRQMFFCISFYLSTIAIAADPPIVIPRVKNPEEIDEALEIQSPTALAFDSRNRPYFMNSEFPRSYGILRVLKGESWESIDIRDSLFEKYDYISKQRPDRFSFAISNLAFDHDDALYATIPVWRQEYKHPDYVLMYTHSVDSRQFKYYELPVDQLRQSEVLLEQFNGHNVLKHPPAIGVTRIRKQSKHRWANYHDLYVILPEKHDNRLKFRKPLKITNRYIFDIASHSGQPNFAVSKNDKVFVVYTEVPDDGKGNPTYVAEVDRGSHRIVAKKYLMDAPPNEPDGHSMPSITVDGTGYLHVLIGAHGQSFHHLRTLEPGNVSGGWTKPVPFGTEATYIGLVCDPDNRLHCVYRSSSTLAHQSKQANSIYWSSVSELAIPPSDHRGYLNYRHRVFIDRRGAIFVSFSFYEHITRNYGPYPRLLIGSFDGGKSWQRATRNMLSERMLGSK